MRDWYLRLEYFLLCVDPLESVMPRRIHDMSDFVERVAVAAEFVLERLALAHQLLDTARATNAAAPRHVFVQLQRLVLDLVEFQR